MKAYCGRQKNFTYWGPPTLGGLLGRVGGALLITGCGYPRPDQGPRGPTPALLGPRGPIPVRLGSWVRFKAGRARPGLFYNLFREPLTLATSMRKPPTPIRLQGFVEAAANRVARR